MPGTVRLPRGFTPDVGGSHDDMVRLVTVRDSLNEWSPDPTVYQVYRARRRRI